MEDLENSISAVELATAQLASVDARDFDAVARALEHRSSALKQLIEAVGTREGPPSADAGAYAPRMQQMIGTGNAVAARLSAVRNSIAREMAARAGTARVLGSIGNAGARGPAVNVWRA